MTTSKLNPKVDWFFTKPTKWQEEYEKLRTIALDCGLAEELKWGCPCYTSGGKNIVLIHGFKEYCAYLFFKGALMKDEHGILIQQTPNVQVPRQVRFTNTKEITKLAPTLKAYIKEAIELEKSGVKATLKKASEYNIPEEFQNKLDENPALKKAFYALTPGRQRGYLFHFSQPKLAKTREARVEKYMKQIMMGKGIDD
jgi:uncharacterized protein YdeI (YjbR/CyaY-like superfamily)